MKFCIETGTIVPDVINYAAHLEKASTRPGTISISRAVDEALPLSPGATGMNVARSDRHE